MSTRETVAKNAVILMGTQVLTWGMTLVLTIFLPRYLGDSAIGEFHLANSLWAIVAIIVAFGTSTLLVKEIARDATRTPELAVNTFLLRSLLFVFGFLGVVVFLAIADYPPETRRVVYIVGASQFVWQLIGVCQASLQGLERMEYTSLGNIAGKAVTTVLSLGLLFAGQGVYAVATVGAVAAVVNLAIQLQHLRRLTQGLDKVDSLLTTSPQARLRVDTLSQLLHEGFPYLMTQIFHVIYMQFDIVIISLLISNAAVGWYGAADRLFGTFLFVPTVVMTAVFPALARRYAAASESMNGGESAGAAELKEAHPTLTEGNEVPGSGKASSTRASQRASWASLHRATRRIFDLLVVLSVPIGLGVLIVADQLVVILFGQQFVNSGPILALMGIVLILTYLNMLLGQFLISMDRQNSWTVVMAVAAVATLPLDLWLIPLCNRVYGNGGIGGAISFIVTEGGMVAAGLAMLPQGVLNRRNAFLAARTVVAGLAMVAGTWWARDMFLGIPIALGILIYAILAWLLRLVKQEDIELARDLIQRIAARLRRSAAASD